MSRAGKHALDICDRPLPKNKTEVRSMSSLWVWGNTLLHTGVLEPDTLCQRAASLSRCAGPHCEPERVRIPAERAHPVCG
jgi:hypothetical protein